MSVFTVLNHLLRLILHFLANPIIPRATVMEMVRLFRHFIINVILHDLKAEVLKYLNHPLARQKIEECFDKYKNIFKKVDTEKKVLALLYNRGFINYKQEKIGFRFTEKVVDGVSKIVANDIYEVYVPLLESLKQFLELPNMYKNLITYMKQLQNDKSGIISNIIQTNFWKKINNF